MKKPNKNDSKYYQGHIFLDGLFIDDVEKYANSKANQLKKFVDSLNDRLIYPNIDDGLLLDELEKIGVIFDDEFDQWNYEMKKNKIEIPEAVAYLVSKGMLKEGNTSFIISGDFGKLYLEELLNEYAEIIWITEKDINKDLKAELQQERVRTKHWIDKYSESLNPSIE